MATIDFEEGEVEDLSDSGHEDSVHEYKVHASQKVGLHKHSKRKRHSQHRTGKIRDSRRRSEALADSCNVETSHTDFENKNRRPKEQDKLPLLEFLSEDEETFVVDRERFDNRRSSEVNRKKKKRRRDSQPKSVSQSRCRYYMDGRCSKGSSCPFLHDFVPNKKKELCKFYAVGMCSKESSCSYLHEEFPCKFFHLTNDCHHGDECKFSHAPLTDFTRSLLEKVVSKHNIDHPSAKSVHIQHTDPLKPPLSGRPGSDNHGDVDYRFDRIPPQMNLSSEKEIGNPGFHPQRMPAVTPNLFAPIYAPGPRQFHPEHDSMHIRGMRPFNMTPGELRPQIVYPKEERCFLSPTTYGPVPYPPHHTMPNSACVPTVNGFRHPSLLETPPRCPQPRVMLPRMRMMDTGNARFPRFTPRCEVFCAPGVRSPTRPIFNSLHEEAIVNSELDKMAALLASSKPITCEPKDDSSVPPSSPLCLNEHNMHPRLESESPQQVSKLNPVPSVVTCILLGVMPCLCLGPKNILKTTKQSHGLSCEKLLFMEN
ncbi:unnamed protein product [Heterobilharzia americana]|nr:unnamed protein product [Heterobilharzia americana]